MLELPSSNDVIGLKHSHQSLVSTSSSCVRELSIPFFHFSKSGLSVANTDHSNILHIIRLLVGEVISYITYFFLLKQHSLCILE